MRDSLVKTLSTFFYVGFLPLIPGTIASLVGVLIFYITRTNFALYICVTLGITFLGFLVSGKAEKIFNKKDAQYIVIDEVAGMLLSLLFVPYNIKFVMIAFVFFRILDITKLYPENRIQNLSGSVGVMGDDIAAGLYTNLIMLVILKMGFF